MTKFNFLIFFLFLVSQMVCQPGPPPKPNGPSQKEVFGNSQNNIIGAQTRSFGGGSIIKPNPMWTFADLAFIGSPSFESFTFRPGMGVGYSYSKFLNTIGANGIITFDLSQQSYSVFYNKHSWYYHVNFAKMTTSKNIGASVTKLNKKNKLNYGMQLGFSVVEDHKYEYFILVPYSVLISNTEVKINEKLKWRPEIFVTLSSPYYDIGKNFSSSSKTFNSVIGNNVSVKVSKNFIINLNYRANLNTTPKFGLMHNFLIGTNLDF